MLFIYFLTDGEISQVAIGWKTLEEFYGNRAKEMSLVFGAVYLEFDRYVYDNHFRFKIDTDTKKLIMVDKPEYLENLLNSQAGGR